MNHIGDWGTQFGMLIAHMKDTQPDLVRKLTQSSRTDGSPESLETAAEDVERAGELQILYREAKARFDADPDFQERAKEEVVRLQSGLDPESLACWERICGLSRKEFQDVYDVLGVDGLEERGESWSVVVPASVRFSFFLFFSCSLLFSSFPFHFLFLLFSFPILFSSSHSIHLSIHSFFPSFFLSSFISSLRPSLILSIFFLLPIPSRYNPLLPGVVQSLEEKGLALTTADGAKYISFDPEDPQGFLYRDPVTGALDETSQWIDQASWFHFPAWIPSEDASHLRQLCRIIDLSLCSFFPSFCFSLQFLPFRILRH